MSFHIRHQDGRELSEKSATGGEWERNGNTRITNLFIGGFKGLGKNCATDGIAQ
jgi:hypothetical protein